MRIAQSIPLVAHLGNRTTSAVGLTQVVHCKPAAEVLRSRVSAWRDAAALMGTRPVLPGGEGARTAQRSAVAHERAIEVVTTSADRRELSGNLRRLFQFRSMFGDEFVGRQASAYLAQLGGLGAYF